MRDLAWKTLPSVQIGEFVELLDVFVYSSLSFEAILSFSDLFVLAGLIISPNPFLSDQGSKLYLMRKS